MLEHARLHLVGAGEQLGQVLGLDPLDGPAQPGLEADVLVGLEQQRVQHRLAELPVAGPRLAGADPLEGADVDEDRPGARERQVVGVAVLHGQLGVEGGQQQVQVDQGGVLQHREGPLVRVADERDPLVLQRPHPGVAADALGQVLEGHLGGPDQLAVVHGLVEEGGGGEGVEVGRAFLGQAAQDPAVEVRHRARRVPERRRLQLQIAHRVPTVCSCRGAPLSARRARRPRRRDGGGTGS